MKPRLFNAMVLLALSSWAVGVSILAIGYGVVGLAMYSGSLSDSAFWRVGIVLTATGTVLAVLLPLTRR